MARGKNMKSLGERLAKVRADMAVLAGQEALLLELMGVTPEAPPSDSVPAPRSRAPRANVKQEVIGLLQAVKGNGLNAAMAVAMAHDERGVRLERGTVSSLLSRMKNEGLVTYIDGLYRLREHSPASEQHSVAEPPKPGASVHPLRASGDGS